MGCSSVHPPRLVFPNPLPLKPLNHSPPALRPSPHMMWQLTLYWEYKSAQNRTWSHSYWNAWMAHFLSLQRGHWVLQGIPSPYSRAFPCFLHGITMQTQYLNTHKHRAGKAHILFLSVSVYLLIFSSFSYKIVPKRHWWSLLLCSHFSFPSPSAPS